MDNYFTTAQAERTRQEMGSLLSDANMAQWMAMHGPIEEREAWRTMAARQIEEIKRMGERDA